MGDWQDLIKLIQDKNITVRLRAADALGNAFSQVPYEIKMQIWQDLHKLTQDKNNKVRESVAYALGKAFDQVPDKTQA